MTNPKDGIALQEAVFNGLRLIRNRLDCCTILPQFTGLNQIALCADEIEKAAKNVAKAARVLRRIQDRSQR